MKALWIFLCVAGTAQAQVEQPVDPFGDNPPPLRVGLIAGPERGMDLAAKLRRIRIPLIEFVDTPLEDALDYLRARAYELDDAATDRDERGINIVVKTTPGWAPPGISLGDDETFTFSAKDGPRVTLELRNVSLEASIGYVAEAVRLEMRVEPEAVVLAPRVEDVAGLVAALAEFDPETAIPPASMLEALESEHRKMKVLEGRLGSDDPGREALSRRMERTRQAIEEARKLLIEFQEAQRRIGEAWMKEVAE